jgi:hypothetical protein
MSHAHHLPEQHGALAARFTDPFPYIGTSRGASRSDRAQKLCEAICFILHMPLSDDDSSTRMTADILHAALVPPPDFVRFMKDFMATTEVSKVVAAAALFYIHLFWRSPEMRRADRHVEPDNEWQIAVVAMMLAHKYLEDAGYKNSSWARVAGVTTQELHETEQFYLECLKYDLYIGVEAYEKWLMRLARYVASRERALSSRSGLSARR